MVVGLIPGERFGRRPRFLRVEDLVLAERERAAGMDLEPLLHHLLQQRRQRDAAGRVLLLRAFPLSDDHGVVAEVHKPRADQLRPPRSRMGGESDHRVEEWLLCFLLDMLQEFARLGNAQEETVPQRLLFLLRKVPSFDLPLDFLPGLEGRLVRPFRVLEPLVGKRRHEPLAHCPGPHAAERGEFLSDRDRADGGLAVILLAPPRVDVRLQMVAGEGSGIQAFPQDSLQVLGMDADRVEGALLDGPPGDGLLVAVDEILERYELRNLNRPGDFPIGEEKGRDIGTWWDRQQSTLGEADVILNPSGQVPGRRLALGFERPVILASGEAKADVIMTGWVSLKPSHGSPRLVANRWQNGTRNLPVIVSLPPRDFYGSAAISRVSIQQPRNCPPSPMASARLIT